MKIEININKKHFWMFTSVVLVLAISIIVYAYETSSPANFGHSAGEVNVVVGGVTKSLQVAIDDGSLGGSSSVPTASSTTLGGVKIGSGLRIDGNGVLYIGAVDAITIGGVCFKPHELFRCYENPHGDHMTWVDNANECTSAGYVVESSITILARC